MPSIHDTMVFRAYEYAKKYHADQKYGDEDYTDSHLLKVLQNDIMLGCDDPDVLASCVLHDIIEDTPVTYIDLVSEFNENVADIVQRVSDITEGSNREETKRNTYPAIAENQNAVFVKLCDRISNVESAIENKRDKYFFMYHNEHSNFKGTLFSIHGSDIIDKAWKKLDDLFIAGLVVFEGKGWD